MTSVLSFQTTYIESKQAFQEWPNIPEVPSWITGIWATTKILQVQVVHIAGLHVQIHAQ